jgi:hypothetical protein
MVLEMIPTYTIYVADGLHQLAIFGVSRVQDLSTYITAIRFRFLEQNTNVLPVIENKWVHKTVFVVDIT